jgi:hypothetical protein
MAGSYGGTCDMDPSSGFDLKSTSSSYGDGLLTALDAAGAYLGTWTFATKSNGGTSTITNLAVDDQGAVYVAGPLVGTADFDPGPAEVTRTGPSTTPYGSFFIVKLDASAAFQWVNVESAIAPTAIAVGPGGSVMAAGQIITADGGAQLGIVQWRSDRSPGWTVTYASVDYSSYLGILVATPKGFFLGGNVGYSADVDPGPGIAAVPSGSIYVAEYAY